MESGNNLSRLKERVTNLLLFGHLCAVSCEPVEFQPKFSYVEWPGDWSMERIDMRRELVATSKAAQAAAT